MTYAARPRARPRESFAGAGVIVGRAPVSGAAASAGTPRGAFGPDEEGEWLTWATVRRGRAPDGRVSTLTRRAPAEIGRLGG